MQCPSCNATIGNTSKFCRYCGVQVFRFPISRISEAASASAAAAPARALTDVTRRLPLESYPIPKRYQAALKSGAKPAEIISELLGQKAEMHNLLESIARATDPAAIKRSVNEFLMTHCVICGEAMGQQESGNTPICRECSRQG